MPVLFSKEQSTQYTLHNIASLNNLAESIAQDLKRGSIICLEGDLGVGKTTFASMIINTLLPTPKNVTSPTFNLLHTYETKNQIMIWHFDLYRLKSLEEVYQLGIEEAFETGISIIEWPTIISSIIPKNATKINMKFSEDPSTRLLHISYSVFHLH